jgi:thiamine biosynthesis protein ThiI
MLASRGFEVVPVHFCLYPYTCEDNFYTAVDVLHSLKEKTNFHHAILFPWSRILRRILRETGKYACLLCRRGMLRAAELLCEREGAKGIVTGESLGQKASQTLQNLSAVSRGLRYPVIRPLLSMDKIEIERISKQFGLWREVHAGCCYATPRYPKTTAKPEVVAMLERKLNLKEMIRAESEHILKLISWDEDLEEFLSSLAT